MSDPSRASALSAIRVLVVDDEVNLRFAIERGLRRAGHQADSASTVRQAIERLRSQPYDTVVTDLRMPGGDGLELIQWLGSYSPSTKILVISAYITEEFRQEYGNQTSIKDNVIAGLRLQGVRNRDELEQTAEKSLRSANLWNEVKDRLDKPGGGLSGGQQQRLCIARAIAVQPDVLLMDEPCSALDPISTLAIEDLIAELKGDYTIVIVTHNMQQAARVSDQTAFFNLEAAGKPGRLVEVDDTGKIFSNPSQKATEDYISGRFG